MLVGIIIGLVIASVVGGCWWLKRNWPRALPRIFTQSDPAFQCMGFDVTERENGLPRVVDCHEMITEKTLHRIGTTYAPGEDGDETESAGEEGTAVMAEYCINHCPGGCNRGCPEPSKEDANA